MQNDGTKTDWKDSALPEWYNKNLVNNEEMLAYAALFDFKKDDSVLDLGCGDGTFLSIAAAKTARATGVDLSPTQLEVTRQKLAAFPNTEVIASSFEDLDLPAQSFTKISIRKAIHHLTEEQKEVLCAKVFNWLKPGGIFIIEDMITMFDINTKTSRRALVEKEAALFYGAQKWEMMREAFFTTLEKELPTDIARMTNYLLKAGFNILKIANKNSLIATVTAQK